MGGYVGNPVDRTAQLYDERYALIGRSRRNLLINGGFNVWQRGSGPFSTTGYSADRWKIMSATASSVVTGGGLYGMALRSFAINHTAAANSLGLQQSLEAADARPIQGKRVTFSIYAYATGGGAPTLNLIVRISATADNSAATFTNLTPVSGTGTFTVGATVQRFSITVDIPKDGTSEGIGFYAGVVNGANGSSTVLLNAQVEIGEEPTDFDVPVFGDEVARCQRYFEAGEYRFGSAGVDASGQSQGYAYYKQTKRRNATVTRIDGTLTNSQATQIQSVTPFGCQFASSAVAVGSSQIIIGSYQADAEL